MMVRGKTKVQYDVRPGKGVYLVTEMTRGRLRVFVVGKDKSCTCGGSANKQCRHIEAVAKYLRLGGQRASERVEKRNDPVPIPSMLKVCPICGAPVEYRGSLWRCSEDSSHYWQWRGEQSGVKDFLTRPHPAKQGAYYEQTVEERLTFLAGAQRRYAAYMMSAMAV